MDENRHSVLTPAIDPSLEMSSSDLFWQEHWRKVAAAVAAVIAAILLAGLWSLYTSHVRSSAEALYSTASDTDGWRQVIEKFPGTVPAGNASIMIANSLREQGDTVGSAAELEALVAAQPNHPLAGAAWLTLGELRQLQGDNEGALDAYRTASGRYSASYAAGLALIAEARLLTGVGRTGEARAILESVGTLYPNTPAAMVATAEKSSLGKASPGGSSD